MTMKRWRTGILVVHLVVLTACASLFRSEEREAGPNQPEEPIMVEVMNMHWSAVNVHVLNRGTTLRLGTLTTNQQERFELPRSFGSGVDIQFIVDPIGSTYGYASERVYAQSGDLVEFRIQNNLSLSTVSKR